MGLGQKRKTRFGPFEFDLKTRELFKSGHRVKLEGQPAQVLAILIEEPGELISREEIFKRLWSANTFVDAERILNADIWKLRQALGDSAERPHYIETLPRKGYRFIGDLEPQESRPEVLDLPSSPANLKASATRIGVAAFVIVIVLVGIVIARKIESTRPPKTRSIESLVVLPFKSLSDNREQDYFADAITDAVIANLSKAPSLRVPSLTTSLAYKNSSKPLKEIAKELNADAVVEGSVLRSGDRVRVTVQLIKAAEDSHLWAETYNSKFSDVLLLQSEIAQSICSEIKLKLSPSEQIEIATTHSVHPEAYDLYLKGRYQYSAWRELDKAVDSFQKAIAKDPNFAPAYAELSVAYSTLGFFGKSTEIFPKARAAADKARELDPTLAEAYVASGIIKTRYEWNWAGAEADFKHALQLKPSNPQTHESYAMLLAVIGRRQEAIEEAREAVSLDPASLEANLNLAIVYMKTHDFDDSIAQFRHVLAVDPGNGIANYQLPWVLAFNGQCEEAIRDYERQNIKMDGFLAYFYGRCGKKAQALAIAREFERLASESYVDPVGLATPFVAAGEKQRALAFLKIAYYDRNPQMMLLKVDPWWDDLHSDPQFQELLARMNFPP